MSLHQILEQKKGSIAKSWFDRVMASYAPDTAQFFKSQRDGFQNPVGHITRESLNALLEGLLRETDTKTLQEVMDPVIRVRAIQHFTPSQATGFIFILKSVIRDTLQKELQDQQILAEFSKFESKIDNLGLIAFDIYMNCREKIHELKQNVEKNKIYKAFARAGLIAEIPDDQPDLKFV